MYTQCPDCSTAFRVTAEVLKQAAGKVRCGGCGNAFNALEYLSETKPEAPATQAADAPLPELTPEPRKTEERAPIAISAEQSAALLKTLDELAGSDIRIEDTGVEWRVLDDEETSGDELNVAGTAMSLGVDELLDESPTPVDQFLTKTPNQVEAGEIFEESANAPAQTPVDELRFDDNTPLPDDFDLDDASSYLPETDDADAQDAEGQAESLVLSEHPRDVDELPADMTLGEADDWADILGEFTEPPRPYVPPLDAELTALEEVLPEDLSDDLLDEDSSDPLDLDDEVDTPLDVDTQFALQAEAMGIDLSGMHSSPALAAEESDLAEGTGDPATDAAPAAEDEADDLESLVGAAELDQAEDTGAATALELADENEETGEVPEIELADETGSSLQLEDESDEETEPDPSPDLDEEEETRNHELDADDSDEAAEAPLEFGSIKKAMADLEEQSDVFDQDFFEDADEIELQPDTGVEEDEIVLEDESPANAKTQHVVPEPSEEEQTLNLLIDQELLNMAVEDEDGFASTIVFAEKGAEAAPTETATAEADEESAAGFESIIMEGEFVRTALDQKKLKADIAAAAGLAEEARLAREVEAAKASGGSKRGMAAAAGILALLLAVQVLHQSREALATIPAFNEAVAPLYR
ncbi:MAG: MJ0042-type zinc finger domain-containing protein, partial [Woeseiaceae bacterium]